MYSYMSRSFLVAFGAAVAIVHSHALSTPTKPRVLVVGGGIGGLSSAFDAHHLIKDAQVTVISDRSNFSFTPSNPWIAFGKRKPEDIQLPLTEVLPRHGIEFVEGRVAKFQPEQHKLSLEGGAVLDYDYLIISTGPRLAFDEIPGLKQHGVSICTTPHALHAYDVFKQLLVSPGPVVIGATQGASCFGPAYEYALLLRDELKRKGGRKLLEQCPITFLTSEPYIGHLGLGGAGNSQEILEKMFAEQSIDFKCNCRITRLDNGHVSYQQLAPDGSVLENNKIPSKLSMFIPPFRGYDVWKHCKELTDANGMIKVDQHQQTHWEDVFAVGICVSLPSHEKTVVPTGVPKTGYMIESMGTAAVKNIQALIHAKAHNKEHELHTKPKLNGLCITDFGSDGAIFLTLPQIPPRRGKRSLSSQVALGSFSLTIMSQWI